MPGHDIIVIGASAGGIESVRELAPLLQANLPASIFLVIHTTPYTESRLPLLLSKWGPLPALHPRDGEAIQPGRIYVAPPDFHLLIGRDCMRVVQGPKENNMRPAIDPLFRTAAAIFGRRVVGAILSGTLDDGSVGLAAIKARGGTAIVQDPAEAIQPEMPDNARRVVDVDYCVTLAQLAPLLVRLAHQPISAEAKEPPVSPGLAFEAAIADWDLEVIRDQPRPGAPSPFGCPDCGGDLWEIDEGKQFHFRCRTGHAWSPLSLLAGQAGGIEDSLNEAFRALLEKAHLERRLSRRLRVNGSSDRADYHDEQAKKVERNALVLQEMLRQMHDITSTEAPS